MVRLKMVSTVHMYRVPFPFFDFRRVIARTESLCSRAKSSEKSLGDSHKSNYFSINRYIFLKLGLKMRREKEICLEVGETYSSFCQYFAFASFHSSPLHTLIFFPLSSSSLPKKVIKKEIKQTEKSVSRQSNAILLVDKDSLNHQYSHRRSSPSSTYSSMLYELPFLCMFSHHPSSNRQSGFLSFLPQQSPQNHHLTKSSHISIYLYTYLYTRQ